MGAKVGFLMIIVVVFGCEEGNDDGLVNGLGGSSGSGDKSDPDKGMASAEDSNGANDRSTNHGYVEDSASSGSFNDDSSPDGSVVDLGENRGVGNEGSDAQSGHQPSLEKLALQHLHGNRYTIRLDRTYDINNGAGRAAYNAKGTELPEDIFLPLNPPWYYTLRVSEDGNTAIRRIIGNPDGILGEYKRIDYKYQDQYYYDAVIEALVIWIEGEHFSVQIESYGSAQMLTNAQRGILIPPCDEDEECRWGMVCEPTDPANCGDIKECIPGCRQDSDCNAGQICRTAVCVTCPCPGTCELE